MCIRDSDPSDLVRGVAVAADKIDDNNGGENEADTVKDGKVLVEPGDGKIDSGKLQRNECAGEYGAGKYDFEKVLHGLLRRRINFFAISYTSGAENSTTDTPVCLTRLLRTAA